MKIFEYGNKLNISEEIKHFYLPKTTISFWKQQQIKILDFDNPKFKCTLYKDGKINFEDIKGKLYNLVIFNRKLGYKNIFSVTDEFIKKIGFKNKFKFTEEFIENMDDTPFILICVL